ncbi:substrate-binding periplasmic protein [Spartinivicinus poritis]|uniref:Transporter substrate-binding domain-containing protein n=1 Tax=Spartinivicinus poritis TaxID=2994640 RepID=A0ABT5U2Z6_9GAMM|nr:transporter substrate-binding domain-containing protein [Spartinivicinus sp. A2-2]MDE1460731.1 transporter substrate-binding domain-containing protein [Spartinivicinus sp. A2-2]
MNSCYRILFVYALILFSVKVASATPIQVTILADDNYYPYSFVENGSLTGAYTKIVMRVIKDMPHYQVNLLPIPWKRGLKLLKEGKAFALYPPYLKRDVRPYIWPVSKPMLDEVTSVFCRNDILVKPRPKWPDDYVGLTIGNNHGFQIGGLRFWKLVKNGSIVVREYKNNHINLTKMLIAKETDCYMNDRQAVLLSWHNLIKQSKWKTAVTAMEEGTVISKEQGHLGFTNQDKGAYYYKQDFLNRFNTVLEKIKRSGELNDLVNQYWNSLKEVSPKNLD